MGDTGLVLIYHMIAPKMRPEKMVVFPSSVRLKSQSLSCPLYQKAATDRVCLTAILPQDSCHVSFVLEHNLG